MENPEEVLHSLEEFSKLKPKDIPRELEEYLCFVAKTGDPVYQWAIIKSLFKEKLINVITDFYESCPTIEVPPCPNVDVFNYESMKSFILEKLDTFAAAPFTLQRICELLTTPRKEYNRIDKYMRALEKNILVVSTTEPLNRRAGGNGEGIVNGLESEHPVDSNNADINVEEMDDTPVWSRFVSESGSYLQRTHMATEVDVDPDPSEYVTEVRTDPMLRAVACRTINRPYVSIEPVVSVVDVCIREISPPEAVTTVTITAIPAAVQKRRTSIEPVVSSVVEIHQSSAETEALSNKEDIEMLSSTVDEPCEQAPIETATIEIIPFEETTEALPTEAESSVVETSILPLVNLPPDISTNVKQLETNVMSSDEDSNSLIQIPIISEITSGENIELDTTTPILSPTLSHDSNSEDSTNLNEPSEVLEEVSTSTPEIIITADPQTDLGNTEITKETSVTSTDDLTSEVDDLKCSQIHEESSSQEESSTESFENASEAQEKQTNDEPLCDIDEFASSSTVSEAMDMNIEEETCQEAPTSNR